MTSIGIPREIKDQEFRVGLTPEACRRLTDDGHRVVVETGAGAGVGFFDDAYRAAGCQIGDRVEVYDCDMVVKVKEPLMSEVSLLKEGQVVFCFLHLAPNKELTTHLLDKKVVAIAFETVTDNKGQLPLLTPMSQIAGRFSVQAGALALQTTSGGRGILLGGVAGVAPATVTVIGGGGAGAEAAQVAIGMGGDVTILDINADQLRRLKLRFGSHLKVGHSSPETVLEAVSRSDLVIGSVLVPGHLAPKVITEKMVEAMRPKSALVDIAIDQGGCSETSCPTTHTDPTYVKHGVVHYCVTNMPGAVALTATQALNYAILPYVMTIARQGYVRAMELDPGLANGLNTCGGQICCDAVAQAFRAH